MPRTPRFRREPSGSPPRPIHDRVRTAVTAGMAAWLLSACFRAPAPPTTFRYRCDGDGDCRDAERCIDDMCQVPCSFAAPESCDPASNTACINGVCASICAPSDDEDSTAKAKADDEACPLRQRCTALPPEAGFDDVGFCVAPCDPAVATSCPETEVCFLGFCVCNPARADACPQGQECVAYQCMDVETDTDGTTTGDDDGGGESGLTTGLTEG